jgi:hypothetical protein
MFYWKAHEHGQDEIIRLFMEGASNWLESYGEIERWFWFKRSFGAYGQRLLPALEFERVSHPAGSMGQRLEGGGRG